MHWRSFTLDMATNSGFVALGIPACVVFGFGLVKPHRQERLCRNAARTEYVTELLKPRPGLISLGIGIRYEQPSEDLAQIGCPPRFRNYVIKAVLAEVRHDRRIRVAAGDD